jgi:ankyrin repeat protein
MSVDLFHAIEQHNLGKLQALLLDGDDPNSTQVEWPRYTALQAAIEELEHGASIDAIAILLKYGASVDGWDLDHDATPLLMAVFRGQRETMRILLEAGADPNVRGSEGDSPLRWCVEQGDREMVELLLHHGAAETINEVGAPRGRTALGLAAERLDVPMIELLINAGADPAALDEDDFIARERLPQRNHSNQDTWDVALGLLSRVGRKKG